MKGKCQQSCGYCDSRHCEENGLIGCNYTAQDILLNVPTRHRAQEGLT